MEGSRATILVVEDDAGIRSMLQLAIEAMGHAIRLEDGLGPIDTDGIDAAIIDVRLGDRTIADVLDAHPELRTRPLIITTADERSPLFDVVPDALRLGKPFDLDRLEAVIEAALGGVAGRR